MAFLGGLLRAGGQLAQVGGAALGGLGEDKETAIKEALTQNAVKRQAAQDAIENQIKLAGIDPTIQGSLAQSRAAGTTTGETPGLVSRAQQMAPIDVKKAVDTAAGVAPIDVKKAVDIETQTQPIKTEGAIQVEGARPDKFTPVTTTAPGGEQHVSSFDSRTGNVTDTGAGAKAATRGAGGLSGIATDRAKTALPQIDNAISTLKQYSHPGLAGAAKLFTKTAGGQYAISDEGQLANQAADALAAAYLGAKTRSGVPSPAAKVDLANSLKIQPGQENNKVLIDKVAQRWQAMRDEIAGLGHVNGSSSTSGPIVVNGKRFTLPP